MLNKDTFCTIVTPEYLSMALALNDSFLNNGECFFQILVCGKREEFVCDKKIKNNIKLHFIDEVCISNNAIKIYSKYFVNDKDAFRWSMKSEFMLYLLFACNFEKVIFVDPDLYFFAEYDFLFSELEASNIILTPHHRTTQPIADDINFRLNFTDGLYNAGFVGCNKHAASALRWWSDVCLYECKKEVDRGFFVDQRYLDLMPILFEGVKIIKHQGCNVANWNIDECQRTLVSNKILINDKYPIVFIHFTKSTIAGILMFNDLKLMRFLEIYVHNLLKTGFTRILDAIDGLCGFDSEQISNSESIAVFGLGVSGEKVFRLMKFRHPNKVRLIIDDNKKSSYQGVPICSSNEFLKQYQCTIDLIIFGKHQKLNHALLEASKVPYLMLEKII